MTGHRGVIHEGRRGQLDSATAGMVRQTAGAARQTAELIALLCLGVLLVRTFSAEAYVVPTGSMAPTLLGIHRAFRCPTCQFAFVFGLDDEGPCGDPICPQCGERGLDAAQSLESGGDRVLVEKCLYAFRRPQRWEVAVFHFPGETSQAYVKRVVGLPGEAVRIIDGEVFVDEGILRKSFPEIRATRILIHDSVVQPRNLSRDPRWIFQCGTTSSRSSSGWSQENGGFAHAAIAGRDPTSVDWLVYKHWDPARRGYGPVCDFYGYNGLEPREYNEIKDLAIDARLTASESVDAIALALRSGSDQFVLRIPIAMPESIELTRNERKIPLFNCQNPFANRELCRKPIRLEVAVFDRRVQAEIDGRPIFDPYEYDDAAPRRPSTDTPVALGVVGGAVDVREFRIYRDVYYTSTLANTPRHPHGKFSTVRLGADEYFVLGDNSPISNDSRFWPDGPVVKGSMFVGRPFLVHIPGDVVPLRIFGRPICWVPDPRRIRYIR
jgi:signal peptidase I